MRSAAIPLFLVAIWTVALLGAAASGPPVEEVTAAGIRYHVQPGDTVRSVAARFHMAPRDFQRQLRRRLDTGAVIIVNPPHGRTEEENDESAGWIDNYRVQPGDTLQRIAAKLSVAPEEIGELNDLTIEADVAAGDTIASLAKQHHVTSDEIADWNDCKPTDAIYSGMRLVVGYEMPAAGEILYYPLHSRAVQTIETRLKQANGADSGGAPRLESGERADTYRVRSGDTVESIARRIGCEPSSIRDENAMVEREQPKSGELLIVPRRRATSAANFRAIGAASFYVYSAVVLTNTPLLARPGETGGRMVARGTRISVTGSWGDDYAVLLRDGSNGWIARRSVRLVAQVGQSGPSAYSQNMIRRVVEIGYTYLGVPYLWGGNTYRGIDCSGLVKNVYVAAGVWNPRAPRRGREQMRLGSPVSPDRLQAGDRVYFYFGNNPPGICDHTGIYIGGGRVLNASSSRGVTTWYLFASRVWKSYMGARRDTAFMRVGSR
jgi:LysM repeat protein